MDSDLHGPTISHLSFDRSMDVRFRLITALRNTGIAVQSVQDSTETWITMIHQKWLHSQSCATSSFPRS